MQQLLSTKRRLAVPVIRTGSFLTQEPSSWYSGFLLLPRYSYLVAEN